MTLFYSSDPNDITILPPINGLNGQITEEKKNWRRTEAKSVQTSFLEVKNIRIPNEYQRYVLKRVFFD